MYMPIKVGDFVVSLTGRDKNKCFLVVNIDKNKVFIVDGKARKVDRPKVKNVKHVKQISTANAQSVAENIKNGQPVGNKRVYKLIMTEKQKIQED